MKPPLRRGAAFFAAGGVRKALSVSDISRQGEDGLRSRFQCVILCFSRYCNVFLLILSVNLNDLSAKRK